MSPVPSFTALAAASGPLSTPQPLPTFTQWSNPLPDFMKNFSQIDNRSHFLQTQSNLWLELHPNGTRGVVTATKFCVLLLFINNMITTDFHRHIQLPNERDRGTTRMSSNSNSQFVIQGRETKNYLCMNNDGVVYQSAKFKTDECLLYLEKSEDSLFERFYRRVNNSKWYVETLEGGMRCGNKTGEGKHKGANYEINAPDKTDGNNVTVPFTESKHKCCPGKKCNAEPAKPKCKRKKKQCIKWRRKFFELSLKDLKKYYRNCIQVSKRCSNDDKNKDKEDRKDKTRRKDRKNKRKDRKRKRDRNHKKGKGGKRNKTHSIRHSKSRQRGRKNRQRKGRSKKKDPEER